MLSMIGLFVALGLLIFLTMKGVNIIIAALICSVLLALTGGLDLNTAMTGFYMDGFTGYFASWFLIFLLGAIFGKVMQDTKSAESIADWVSRTLGPQWAVFAVVSACAIMTYGGVSLFVVGFTVYPIAVSLFRLANYPHRFIPAALVFGSISFTMTSPGSPEIQNLIPTEFFGTTPTAGGWVGVVMGVFIATVGGLWLRFLVRKAVANGETFELPKASPFYSAEKVDEIAATTEEKKLPNVVFAILPLAIVILVLNILSFYMAPKTAALVALVLGILSVWGFNFKFVQEYWNSLAVGAQNSLVAIANTCAVVGFGSVAAQVSAFDTFINALVNISGPPLLGLAIGVTIICGLTGSASGGLGIALPLLAPIYLAKGIDPGSMHRVSALASGGLDSLPHNGYVVTTVRAICGETHKKAYLPILCVSVILPTIAVILAIALYSIF
ncbi:GntP family permease [Halalkalibacter akibai]|uniref:D-beta-hydroxybutyrate permease n=1 Tax=Halalkalibacter akibai (strain ATCC 43226 / DSM 21942 / CIP 109018 / JCM 9157 / 1139) TaxID=1236973 RepID=W4QSL7_HALA3|nr:SLC13 family permease [Halalkalibacter akibai]GAE35120.1 D-beta-hydroxybutyrate permease [Halalkalibacter akibai JCM 9157]